MKLRKPLALLVFSVLLTFEALAMPQPSIWLVPAKRKAAAKKQTAKVEPPAPDTTPQASEDPDVERITVDELKAKIAKNEPLTIIDARSDGSYEASEMQIKGAIRMTTDDIQSRSKEVPRDREVVIYCT